MSETQSGFRWTPTTVALLVAVILIVMMWAYILSPWSKTGDLPTTLKDKTYAATAEPLCAATQAQIAELPKAFTAGSPEERASVLTQADAMVATLVKQLHGLEPKVEQDRQFTDQWLADWDSYLTSRQRYAAILATGEDERFTVEAEGGHPITERMDGFAMLNNMPSCQVPLDVG
ncbi:MAG TPA: hypothetical protein VGM78_12540 [Ilumatobacteraceae bacterium]